MTRIYRHDPMEIALRAMPGTLKEIAASTGVPKSTVQTWLRKLKDCGWTHIGKWKRDDDHGLPVPVMYGGQGRNAICRLKPLTQTELTRRYKNRLRERGEFERWQAGHTAKRRVKRMLTRLKGRPPTPFDALMM